MFQHIEFLTRKASVIRDNTDIQANETVMSRTSLSGLLPPGRPANTSSEPGRSIPNLVAEITITMHRKYRYRL